MKKQLKKPARKSARKQTSLVKRTTQALAPIKKETHLSLTDPRDVMNFGKVLKAYIAKNNLSIEIKGNNYAMVDGWKFAGLSFGLTAIPEAPVLMQEKGQYITILYTIGTFLNRKTQQEYKKEYICFAGFSNDEAILHRMRQQHKVTREVTHPYFNYKCECKIVRLSDGVVVGSGWSMCSNMEEFKVEFEEYAVASMSQTRCIGKAYRNQIGFIMKDAGLEGTPAEEMKPEQDPLVKDKPAKQTPAAPNMPPVTLPPLNEKQLNKLLDRINKGEDLLQLVKTQFTTTEKQIQALEAADQRRIDKLNK